MSQCRHHRQPEHQDDGKRGLRGYNAAKKVTGRKRHLAVDTLGCVLVVVVHAANVQDRDGAKLVVERLQGRFERLLLIWADGGYAGQLVDWVKEVSGWALEIITRLPGQQGFAVLPKRWVVERTFAWLGQYRRLSKDYEECTESSEAMILIAMIQVMVRRLEP
jgi:putative transposase